MSHRKFFPLLLLSAVLFADGPSGERLTGKIEALPAGTLIGNWTVAGRTIQVSAQTRIDTPSGPAVLGACVDIRGTALNPTTIAATSIDTRPASKCAGSSTSPGTIEIYGSVEQLPASGLIGDWRVANVTVRVTAQTVIEQDGGPVAVGSCVEVKGTREAANTLAASKIEVKSASSGCRPGGPPTSPGQGSRRDEIEFRGTVQAAPPAGSELWTISGRKVLINPQTAVTPAGRPLAAGLCVEVKGILETDSSVTASRVQVQGSGVCTNGLERQADVSFHGAITSLPASGLIGNWNISGLIVTVTEDTGINDEAIAPAAGVCVEVKGEFGPANTVNATRIETRPPARCQSPTGAYRFEGAIQAIPSPGPTGNWTIGNRTVVADANTVFDTTRGPASLGACVAVTGQLQSGASVRASRVEVLSASGSCIFSGGIVGAANLAGFGVAPAQIISIFGRQIGPATTQPLAVVNGKVSNSLANTRVLFDGTPATLLFASEGQINAIVPCNVAGKTSVQVQIESNGAWTNTVTLPVYATYPSIFTLSNSGVGRGAILNADNSVNAPNNPVERGQPAILFGTGEGQTTPACADGEITNGASLPTPVAPVSVEVGGQPATVVYAGGAPGLVRGVLQVNFIPAASAPTGPNVPVTLKIGDRISQSGVTIAVK